MNSEQVAGQVQAAVKACALGIVSGMYDGPADAIKRYDSGGLLDYTSHESSVRKKVRSSSQKENAEKHQKQLDAAEKKRQKTAELQKVGHDGEVKEALSALQDKGLSSSNDLMQFTATQLKGLLLARAATPVATVKDPKDPNRKKKKPAQKSDWAAQLFLVLDREARVTPQLVIADKL